MTPPPETHLPNTHPPDTLYSRAGCHLCEQAEAALDALGWAYVRVDISGDEALEQCYGWDVPVLTRGQGEAARVLAKGVLSAARLRQVRAQAGEQAGERDGGGAPPG